MKQKIIIILLVLAGILYLGGHYVFYGSITRNCIYTENELPIPEELAKGKIVIARGDVYVAIGLDKEHSCLGNFGNIGREIVGPDIINNITIGRKYFTNKGLTVESLKKGTSLSLVGIIAVTPHGISTIGGGGPIYYLILRDQNNLLYKVATVSLGLNKGDQFLSFEDFSQTNNTSSIKLLSPDSFERTVNHEGEKSLKYTGKLVDLTTSYLESVVPQWKKMADRLEKGEKFLIHIDIELRDNSFREIMLSNSPDERYRQVTQIQDEFLKQIPASITLKDVEKNKAWPYVSMEANLDLLNYLVDHQVELKIKSISELTKQGY